MFLKLIGAVGMILNDVLCVFGDQKERRILEKSKIRTPDEARTHDLGLTTFRLLDPRSDQLSYKSKRMMLRRSDALRNLMSEKCKNVRS